MGLFSPKVVKYLSRRRSMDLLDRKTDKELLQSLLAELAKAKNELACAKGDIDKINSRLSFLLVAANTLIKRQGD
jgi:predicted transcriptional regulator